MHIMPYGSMVSRTMKCNATLKMVGESSSQRLGFELFQTDEVLKVLPVRPAGTTFLVFWDSIMYMRCGFAESYTLLG